MFLSRAGRPRSNQYGLVRLFVLGLFVLSFGEAAAQNPPAPDGTPRTSNGTARDDVPPPKIRRAPLDALVVFTTEGARQTHIRLPGWRIEELDNISNFYLKERQISTPSFILQEIVATGKVVENHVETEVRIVLTTPGSRSVLVPIGMKEGILPFFTTDAGAPKPYRYHGPGTLELMADPQNGQYLALIHPPPSSDTPDAAPAPSAGESGASEPIRDLRHELTLTLWFPLNRTGGDENRLAVSFPQAVSSQFLLTVPMEGAVANVAQGFLLDLQESSEQGTTQFKILGLKPDFEVTWRRKKTETFDERPVLSMEEASIIARMEARSTVYDVTFPIRSPNRVGFERVRIQMPPGTTLDHESTERYAAQGGYTFGFLTDEERKALTPPANEPMEGLARPEPAQILEIRLPRKTVGPVNISFRAVQQDDHEQTGEWRNLGGFAVREAARQTGRLAVIIPPNLRPNWSPIRGIRRSETGGGVSLDGVDARFDFFSQPFLLRCRLVSPQTKINVKPEYLIRINKGSLALTAKFSYVVYGTKTDRLAVNLPGWQWNSEITPTGIVDSVGVEQDENGLLTIPLRTPQDGEFEIELKAFRPLSFPDEEKHRLTVPLPQPTADWIKAAPVVIVSADNVEMIPVDEGGESGTEELSTSRTVNLSRRSRRSLPVTIEIPERQQEPLFYETEPGVQVFVADVQYQRQKIAAAMQTEIRLRAPDEHVTQYISYDVSYVPIERVYFLVPKSLEENGALSARIGGKVVELRDVVPGAGETVPENWSKKMLQLPEAQFRFQAVFDYTIPPVPIEHDLMTPFSLSFIRPYDVPVTDHRVNMMVPTGFRIEPDDEARAEWTPVESETTHSGTGFRSSQTPDRISLWISTGERDALGTTVVERAWLQTWLYGTIREDRGSYLVTSDRRESVTMWLPPEAAKSRVFVFRDGTPVLPEISPRGELTIPLPDQKGSPMLIEIIYRITPFETSNGRVEMELPHFGSSLVRSEYWQIILPQNRHVIGVPGGWTPEYDWAWTNGLFWGRVPSLTREDVGFEEKPSGATLIPTESNQYLFSSLHPPSHVSLSILDRSLIVLLSSGLSLVVGLVLIYFPKTRYVGSLFGLAVALLAMMLYRPAPVLLMLQASSLGVLLALGACYVHRILYREEKWVVPKTRAWDDASSPPEVYSVLMEDDSEKKPEGIPDSDEENRD